MQIEEFLEHSARRVPGKAALVCGMHRWTYRELDRFANRLAHDLIAAGIRRGDRVAVFAANSLEAVVAVFAILKAGGIFLVINPTTKPDKLAYILNHCAAAGVICDARRYPVLEPCRATG